MHLPTAAAADVPNTMPQGPDSAPDQLSERAAWALALAAWMHPPEPDVLPSPAPEAAPGPPHEIPVEWWHIMPHASDWWM